MYLNYYIHSVLLFCCSAISTVPVLYLLFDISTTYLSVAIRGNVNPQNIIVVFVIIPSWCFYSISYSSTYELHTISTASAYARFPYYQRIYINRIPSIRHAYTTSGMETGLQHSTQYDTESYLLCEIIIIAIILYYGIIYT